MVADAAERVVNPSIPRITCPQCGSSMVLSRIEPEAPNNRDRMFFDCVCGFEYRISDPANKGR
jgi:hypothetical protein